MNVSREFPVFLISTRTFLAVLQIAFKYFDIMDDQFFRLIINQDGYYLDSVHSNIRLQRLISARDISFIETAISFLLRGIIVLRGERIAQVYFKERQKEITFGRNPCL